ncbi:hypothetical protein J1N35_017075 [Gossypium stocksii]|uniref:PGG domain-containing protein n=1 Tax=Gossypium stocksii TaxID=47602 RepID=A0A9D3VNA9_9ROSI|nr:hypothetical protein J1N35_017075 [Gossypium stocksii]
MPEKDWDQTCNQTVEDGPTGEVGASGSSKTSTRLTLYAPLHQVTMKGAANVRITNRLETALHIAVRTGHIGFVEKIVKLMSVSDLEQRDKSSNTALFVAAASGITTITEKGHQDMVWYLYNVTATEYLNQKDYIGLLIATITTDLFDVTLFLLQYNPELAIPRDSNGETALHVVEMVEE